MTSTNPKKVEDKSLIKTLKTKEEFDEILKSIKDKFILVEFYATWCAPCKILGMKFKEFAEKYSDKLEVFLVDVDDLEDLAIEYEVNNMPSYMIMQNGVKLDQYFGSKLEQMEEMEKKYLMK